MLHISIKAEPIFRLFNFVFTNSYFASTIVLILLTIIAVSYKKQSESQHKNGFYYIFHMLIRVIYGLIEGVTKEKTTIFFPLLGALFIYIMFQNWFGLVPGSGSILVKSSLNNELVPLLRGASADLNFTLALGLLAVIAIQYFGIKYLGFGGYLKKFINFANPINFFLGILDIISEVSRIVSFSFRLFGNIFAGEVLLAVIAFLVPVLISFPFFIMEVFVGFIQALVFSMLTAVFLNMAIMKHH